MHCWDRADDENCRGVSLIPIHRPPVIADWKVKKIAIGINTRIGNHTPVHTGSTFSIAAGCRSAFGRGDAGGCAAELCVAGGCVAGYLADTVGRESAGAVVGDVVVCS